MRWIRSFGVCRTNNVSHDICTACYAQASRGAYSLYAQASAANREYVCTRELTVARSGRDHARPIALPGEVVLCTCTCSRHGPQHTCLMHSCLPLQTAMEERPVPDTGRAANSQPSPSYRRQRGASRPNPPPNSAASRWCHWCLLSCLLGGLALGVLKTVSHMAHRVPSPKDLRGYKHPDAGQAPTAGAPRDSTARQTSAQLFRFL